MQRLRKFLKSITLTEEIIAGALIALAAGFVLTSSYGYLRIAALSNKVAALDAELASSSARFSSTISDATTSLSNALQTESQNIKNQLGGVQDQVGVIGGAVTDLKKLSATDQELLAKYSKVFFLSENYEPTRLVSISPDYRYHAEKELQIIPQVLPYLEKMLAAAKADGVDIYVDSAYRSFAVQTILKNQYKVTYGAGTANQFSADQGYSEHQLGTTIDFITTGTNGQLIGFDKRPAYEWLTKNAYLYGFILSYPKSNTYYIFEPWHWRFVGVKLATDLHDKDEYFYELDQRTIDAYLTSLFD